MRYIISVDRALKKLIEKDILVSFIETSGLLENFLIHKLVVEGGINPNLIKNWTLGRLLEWVDNLTLIVEPIEKEYLEKFSDFKELRNFILHKGSNSINHDEVHKILEKLIDQTLKGIANSPIKGEPIAEEKLDKFFDDYYKKKVEIINKHLEEKRS